MKMNMNMNNKLLAQMRAATRNLMKKPQVDTNKVIQDALKNASALTQAAQAQMSGLSQANGLANLHSAGDVPDMLAELSRKFGHGGAAANEPAALLPGTFSEGSFTNRAGTRSYKLYVPSNYQGKENKPTALVVMLHGCTQDPDDFATGTQMNALAEETGCLVVYPSQSRQANSSRCWNWFNAVDQRRGEGEPSLIADMTQAVMASYSVDADQVYVAGLSAGGAMATIMGTLYPDLYAAVGVHSGLPFASANDLSSALAAMKGDFRRSQLENQPLPVIVFHGDRDTTVHPANGEEVVAQGARHLPQPGTTEPGNVPDGHAYTRTLYPATDGTVQAEHWLVHGAGHAWSGGQAQGSYTDGKGPDASREMMRFFRTQR